MYFLAGSHHNAKASVCFQTSMYLLEFACSPSDLLSYTIQKVLVKFIGDSKSFWLVLLRHSKIVMGSNISQAFLCGVFMLECWCECRFPVRLISDPKIAPRRESVWLPVSGDLPRVFPALTHSQPGLAPVTLHRIKSCRSWLDGY